MSDRQPDMQGGGQGLLAGKIVLITGAASGIGAATARAAARDGALVALADRNLDGARALAREIAQSGATAEALAVDVADRDSVAAMVAGVVDRFGRLDAALNNAGIGSNETGSTGLKTGELDYESWRLMIDVNLTGVWLCMKHELATMTAGASIVNMASIAGLVGMPMASHYAAAKHGVIGLTKSAAIDYGRAGIRVNAICPGYVETPLIAHSSADKLEAIARKTPIGRLARAEEIADQAVWLMSDRSAYVTGAALAVDGGFTST